jgi:hypothetical protein
LDVSILNLGANVSENLTQRVSFAIKFPTDTDKATEAAKIAKAAQVIAESELIQRQVKEF